MNSLFDIVSIVGGSIVALTFFVYGFYMRSETKKTIGKNKGNINYS